MATENWVALETTEHYVLSSLTTSILWMSRTNKNSELVNAGGTLQYQNSQVDILL